MGGPTLSLWLREGLTKAQIEEMDVWFHSLSSNVKPNADWRRGRTVKNPSWNFNVCEAAFSASLVWILDRKDLSVSK